MHQAPGDDDTTEITEIRGRMHQPSRVAAHLGSPEKASGILQRMELVLGLRLHSLILGAAAGTPIVGIDYDPKIRGFMEQAGAEDYLIGVMDPPRGPHTPNRTRTRQPHNDKTQTHEKLRKNENTDKSNITELRPCLTTHLHQHIGRGKTILL